MKQDTKNLYLAIILAICVIYITNSFFKTEVKNVTSNEAKIEAPQTFDVAKEIKTEELKVEEIEERDIAINKDSRITIDTKSLEGSIRLKGARIDDLALKRHTEKLDKASGSKVLLSPAKTETPYFIETGWISTNKNIKTPNSKTIWKTKSTRLTENSPVQLEWDNGQGLKFIRTISLDENYMFKINSFVENNSNEKVTIYPYGLISRYHDDSQKGRNILHQGSIGVFNSVLEEDKFSDIQDEKTLNYETKGGWFGITDKYWLTALILDKNSNTNTKVKVSAIAPNKYQTDYINSAVTIEPNATTSVNNMIFAGAKEIKLLDKYKDELNIEKFDLSIDFGWYYFLTKPFFYILDFLYNFLGNMGWAIILFAALLRLAMFPVANKSYTSMSKMKIVQPKLKALQEKYADDKVRLQQETMALYKKEKINPAAGCLPMLIQIPVFFSLYKVLYISIEIRHAPFIGWIKDLGAPDPLTISAMTNIPLPGFIDIGVWPIIMGLTMWAQQRLNPAPTNKDQANVMKFMPLFFTFMLGNFASGLVIYWTLSNLISIIQQKVIMNKLGAK